MSVESILRAIKEAEEYPPEESLEAVIARLAKLTPIEYDQVRIAEAKAINVRPTTLDKEVARERNQEPETSSDEVVEELSSWENSVDGAELLDELENVLAKHVILPKGATTVVSLWVLGTYCMDSWRVWPKLLITSPEKRCGKSTLLETVEGLVYRALLTSNISSSAIFRCIEEWAPCLLIDEADTFTKDNDELNGVINAGHTKRTAVVIRSEKSGDTFKPSKFSVWCPQVIAGIGEQRGTLHDRSIHLELRRKLPEEQSAKLPAEYYEQMRVFRRMCLRWAEDHTYKLKHSMCIAPACGNDRAQDNWTPLFTIAELVGGNWPEKVRAAYTIFIEAVADVSKDASHLLIEDISEILDDWSHPVMFSRVLVDKLVELEDRPWFEWKRGKPLTQNSLARLLRPYGLTSTAKRIGGDVAKGYDAQKMRAAFTPYLPTLPPKSVKALHPMQDKGSKPISKGYKDEV